MAYKERSIKGYNMHDNIQIVSVDATVTYHYTLFIKAKTMKDAQKEASKIVMDDLTAGKTRKTADGFSRYYKPWDINIKVKK